MVNYTVFPCSPTVSLGFYMWFSPYIHIDVQFFKNNKKNIPLLCLLAEHTCLVQCRTPWTLFMRNQLFGVLFLQTPMFIHGLRRDKSLRLVVCFHSACFRLQILDQESCPGASPKATDSKVALRHRRLIVRYVEPKLRGWSSCQGLHARKNSVVCPQWKVKIESELVVCVFTRPCVAQVHCRTVHVSNKM